MNDGDVGEHFLSALAGADPAIPAGHVAVVVAHPDDETLGIGAQLPRLRDVTLVHVTDGAPRSGGDAARHGFAAPRAYAEARRRELEAAMALAGVVSSALVGLDIPDQEAALHLAPLARRLADLFRARGITLAVTHAYEGGHPDHEATAFAVHAARRLLQRQHRRSLTVVEMPFYQAGPDGWARQQFLPDVAARELVLRLTPSQQALKRRMIGAHATQRETLSAFSLDRELFRVAPDHAFERLPNGGVLLYERHGWGLTGARWQALVAEASRELDADAAVA